MDEASTPPETPAPAPSSPEKGRGVSAATVALLALLGTSLGIVGTIATTIVGARYTAREHAEDRAEERAKDRRETITKVYLSAYTALKPYQDETLRFQMSHDPNDKLKEIQPPQDVDAMLRLMGSKAAVKAFDDALIHFGFIRGTAPPSHERIENILKFYDSCSRFNEAARADMQSNNF